MYQKYHDEFNYRSIRRSMIVLFLSFVLVYLMLYHVKWDLLKDGFAGSLFESWDVVISEVSTWNTIFTWDSELNLLTWDSNADVSDDLDSEESVDSSGVELSHDFDTIILSWTKTYYWELDFVEKLWISYNYALRDDKNIYYLNMWNYDYDFSDIVRKLWWSLYIMNTEQEIVENGLFGDKITYINIPEYKNKKVLMLLEIDDSQWLIAINYSIYHQVKPYLKTLFID